MSAAGLPEVPGDVRKAREELARRAVTDGIHPTLEDLTRAWIVQSSTWRMKAGSSQTCAVCNRRKRGGDKHMCGEHLAWRFLWNHHSWHGMEQWRFTVQQLHNIAGLPVPEEYLDKPKADE